MAALLNRLFSFRALQKILPSAVCYSLRVYLESNYSSKPPANYS